MKAREFFGIKKWLLALATFAIILGTGSFARAELVYDEDIQSAPAAQEPVAPSRAEDRENLRNVISTSEKARTSAAPAPAPLAPAPVARRPLPVAAPAAAPATQDVVVTSDAAGEPSSAVPAPAVDAPEHMSRSELLRRERLRQELRTEDSLQERLEELRLRDERRRAGELLPADATTDADAAPRAGAAVPAAALKDEAVSAPVTERPGEAPVAPVPPAPPAQAALSQPVAVVPASANAVAPAPAGPAPASLTAGPTDQISMSHASAVSTLDAPASDEPTRFVISPRGGMASMTGTAEYNVNPRFSIGIGAGVEVSDNLTLEGSYSYNEYGISQPQTMMMTGYNYETLALKQNVADLGMRIHFLGPDAKVRPFIGGGGAYSKGYINYSDQIKQFYAATAPALAQDYELQQYLGYLSTGFDVRLSRSITFGALLKYYSVLSANEPQLLNTGAFVANAAYADWPKFNAGGSLARASFFQVSGGVNFAF